MFTIELNILHLENWYSKSHFFKLVFFHHTVVAFTLSFSGWEHPVAATSLPQIRWLSDWENHGSSSLVQSIAEKRKLREELRFVIWTRGTVAVVLSNFGRSKLKHKNSTTSLWSILFANKYWSGCGRFQVKVWQVKVSEAFHVSYVKCCQQ